MFPSTVNNTRRTKPNDQIKNLDVNLLLALIIGIVIKIYVIEPWTEGLVRLSYGID